MSAAADLANLGTGAKNLAIGIAVIAGVAAVVYLAVKGKQAAAAVGQAAKAVGQATKDTAGYLFGADYASATVGTDLYDLVNDPPPSCNEEQARKMGYTCKGGRPVKAPPPVEAVNVDETWGGGMGY